MLSLDQTILLRKDHPIIKSASVNKQKSTMTDQAEEEFYLSTTVKTEDDCSTRGLRACRSPTTVFLWAMLTQHVESGSG